MKQSLVVILVATTLFAPGALAQWIDDAEGDAVESVGTTEVAHGRAGMVDIHSVDIEETEGAVRFTVLHAPTPGPHDSIIDAVVFDLIFRHGELWYQASITYGIPLAADAGYSGEMYNQGGFLRDLEVEEVDGGFAVELQKTWIRDQNGMVPAAGAAITDFVLFSNSQNQFGICVVECTDVGLGASDQAPDGEIGAVYDFVHGLAQEGDIRLHSAAPMRWSNGEATVFVYEIGITNIGQEADTVMFHASQLPAGWQVANLPHIDLTAGETRTIPVAVKVPFSHQHGSDQLLLLEAIGQTGIGRLEIGVHYSEVPQPTGHHAQVFFHTREVPTFFLEPVVFNTVGGNVGTQVFMNTVDNFAGDEDISVPGTKGVFVLDADLEAPAPPAVGLEYEWAIPLNPSLRVGLQTNASKIAEGEVQLSFDVPVGDVRVHGRVAVIEGPFFSDAIGIDDEQGLDLATIPLTETHAITDTVTVPFQVQTITQTIPFANEQHLVLFLTADVLRPDSPFTPNTGVYMDGGNMIFPLDEYHDTLPVNVTFPQQIQDDAIAELDEDHPLEEAKDTPATGAFTALAAMAIAAIGRRRQA